MKTCSHCHIQKPLTDFPHDKQKKDGHGPRCKQCKSQQARNAYAESAGQKREKNRLRMADWRAKNPERNKANKRRHHAANRTKILQQQRAFREKYPDKIRQYERRWKAKHPEKLRAKQKRGWFKHREKRLQTHKLWYQANKHVVLNHNAKRRALIKNATVVESVNRQDIYKRDKGICQLCFQHVSLKDMAMDHVIPLSKGGAHSYQNIVLTHHACNASKGNRAVPQQQRLFG